MVPRDVPRPIGRPGSAPRAAAGITAATWLWLISSGLAFWLAVAQGVIWLT